MVIDTPEDGYTYHWINPLNGNEIIQEGTSISDNILSEAIGRWATGTQYNFGVFRSANSDINGNVCPSDTLTVTIIIYDIPGVPISYTDTINKETEDNFKYCYKLDVSDLVVGRNMFDDATSTTVMTWYEADGTLIKNDVLAIGAEYSSLTATELNALIPKDDSDFYIPATYSFKVTQTDALTCASATTTINITVIQLPLNAFTIGDGLINEFCILNDASNEFQVALFSGIPNLLNYTWTFELFNDNNEPIDGVVNNNAINPFLAGVGTHTVVYTVTDFNTDENCSNSLSKEITIHASPNTEFSFTNLCNSENAVQFTDLTTLDLSIGDVIAEWDWDFNDGINSESNEQNPIYNFKDTGPHTVTLTVTTAPYDNGNGTSTCSISITKNISIEAIPVSNFVFLNDCLESSIEFNDDEGETNGSFIKHGSIVERIWDFGDGNVISESNEMIVNHKYLSIGTFQVSLTTINEQGCDNTITKRIAIFPNVDVTAENYYFQNFDTLEGGLPNDHGWVSKGSVLDGNIVNSWVLSERELDETWLYSGDSAWVSGKGGQYISNEKSFVESPCFNLSQLNRPMISFKYRSGTEDGRDGAVLQYTLDNGNTWVVLGNTNSSAINWYNSNGIIGNPGGQGISSVGWSGNTAQNSFNGWRTAAHYLDQLEGQTSVRFRIAFGADSQNTGAGFAFDDVFIGERTKNVLLEAFSNNRTLNNALSNNKFESVINSTIAKDFTLLKYYLNFGGDNQLYLDNANDPSARALYYGILEADRVTVDGLNIVSSIDTISYDIQEEALETPWFEIKVTQTQLIGDEIQLNVHLTASDSNTISDEILIQVAVIEKVITNKSIIGNNGETEFTYVLKDMIPNAAGISIDRQWKPHDTLSRDIVWDNIFNFYDSSEAEIIVFVQNNLTKEVYQSVSLTPAGIPPVITALSKELPADLKEIKLYPNPATFSVNLSFSKVLEKTSDWKIYNQFGMLINSGNILKGKTGITLDISKYPKGIYYIEISRENKVGVRKKFLKH